MNIHIFYATQTGNAADCAKTAQKIAQARGLSAAVSNLGDIEANILSETSHALFIVSTWGEGEPPDDAVPFYDKLLELPSGSIPSLGYGVFALGDSAYENFCGFGKKLDKELSERGARQLLPNVECDVSYEDELNAWLPKILESLASHQSVSTS